MHRPKSDVWSHSLLASLLLGSLLALCTAGPLGPLPNITVTTADLGLKEGGCAVGDLVYLPGDEFPGASACEKCRCAGGRVTCARARCEPRPGCKALHRPDHCCPTYQCECEQEGRVYGNGEKLVDPLDPCRVCYCQGGEVVCRRIACFRRDDCVPRAVPGRCCPEYDNCPLRGVTAIPGMAPSISSVEEASSPAPSLLRENIKQEITIKEITPVSEIPVLPEVKVKEILPTPGLEVSEYASSKSPLIVREATSERTVVGSPDNSINTPVAVEVQPSSSESVLSVSSQDPTHPSSSIEETQGTKDSLPSKISLSTQDLTNSDVYTAAQTSVATISVPAATAENIGSSKAPVEEEETSLFDHNPAFPPLPDDLSVINNHDDELISEQMDTDHGLHDHLEHVPSSTFQNTENDATFSSPPDAISEIAHSVEVTHMSTHSVIANDLTTVRGVTLSRNPSTVEGVSVAKIETTSNANTTKSTIIKDSPMLNLRSAIPTDILNIPSSVPEEITGELDEVVETSPATTEISTIITSAAAKETITTEKEISTELPNLKTTIIARTTTSSTAAPTIIELKTEITSKETTSVPLIAQTIREQTPGPEAKSSIVTEITSQTEFSSLPIETSDQNPRENLEIIEKEKSLTSTADPATTASAVTKEPLSADSEVITMSSSAPTSTENQSTENIETTEFVITSFGSSETATDNVELIKISAEPDRNAAIIDANSSNKNSVLTDLINLVGDVASIGDHTDPPAAPAMISESEELILVNAGYKSKNNNWNQNSITEMPVKSKPTGIKQKIVEIEDDEAGITDSSPPHDRIEPTTRRPIIDSVDDTKQNNHTEKKDIEIITKSYVPTINRRPTKVVMKKNNERPLVKEEGEKAVTELSTSGIIGAGAESTSPISTSGFTTASHSAQTVDTSPVSATASMATPTDASTASAATDSARTSLKPEDDVDRTTTLNH